MIFPFTTQPASFIERPNRFRVVARLLENGEVIDAHCADPGRLRELLIPSVIVHVSKATNPNRKTAYDLRFVEHPEHGQLVSLDTRLPNQIFTEGLEDGFFHAFRNFQEVKAEVSLPRPEDAGVHSRFDFRLIDKDGRTCWIEVKSVTLVEGRVARFPDAPTERGRRHLTELAALAKAGNRAAVVFIVQRPDADRFEPNRVTDPDFAEALAAAQAAGVEVFAVACRLTTTEISLERYLPVHATDRLKRTTTENTRTRKIDRPAEHLLK